MQEHALLALIALLLNAALGGPRRYYIAFGILPALYMPAQWLRAVERKLNREHRSLKEREMRGVILVGILMMLGTILGMTIEQVFTYNLQVVELLLLTCLLPVRSAWDIIFNIRKSLESGALAEARMTLDFTPWRHHALLDEHGVSRAGIELMSVYFSEKIVAPIFWYVLLGLPGLFISKLINLMQESMSQPLQSEEGFGKAAQAIHQLLHFIPSRIAALMWLGAALFLPTTNWRTPWHMLRVEMSAKPERLAVACAAACLALTLGGPTSLYTGGTWVGSGTAKAGANDLKRAGYFYGVLYILLFVFLWLFM